MVVALPEGQHGNTSVDISTRLEEQLLSSEILGVNILGNADLHQAIVLLGVGSPSEPRLDIDLRDDQKRCDPPAISSIVDDLGVPLCPRLWH